MMRRLAAGVRLAMLMAASMIAVNGCDRAYYGAMEKLGHHKRDIMVDRVESARNAQQEAKAQFESALEKFNSIVGYRGGDLADQYDQLKSEYDKSRARAQAVKDRVAAVEQVSEDLFAEWERELDEYSSADLRRSSERKLKQTRGQYGQLIAAMKRAEQKTDPVLAAFKDQVLFLKHNLNAKAIASLQQELSTIETDVAELIREMESSIREADTFISNMAIQN